MTASENTFICIFFLYLAEYFCIFIFHHSKNEIRIRDKNIPVLLQTTIQIWAIQAEIHWMYHRQQVAKFCHFISLWTLIDVCHSMESFFYDFSIHWQQTKEQFTEKNIRKTLSPDSFEQKPIDRNRCRTSKVIHIQIRNNQERDSVSDFTLACDSRWHHFESTLHALLVQSKRIKMKMIKWKLSDHHSSKFRPRGFSISDQKNAEFQLIRFVFGMSKWNWRHVSVAFRFSAICRSILTTLTSTISEIYYACNN